MEENLRLIKPFIRGSFLIILSMVIAVVVAKKYLSYVVPMYESTTKLKLADVSEGIQSSNLFKDFDIFASSNKIAAEIEVLKSSVLLNKTLDSLDFDVEIFRKGQLKSVELYEDSPFLLEGSFTNSKVFDEKYGLQIISEKDFEITIPGIMQSIIKGTFGEPVLFKYGEFIISLNGKYISNKPDLAIIDQYEFEFLSRQKLVSKILKDLDIISVDKDVAIIRINFKSSVPAKAALFVNTLAKTYIEDYINTKYKAAETTVEFLDEQLVEVSKKLSRAESNIKNYRNVQKITNIRQETETDLRKISQLKIQQTNVKMNLLAIQSLNKYIQNGKDNFLELAPNFEAFTDLLSTEIIKSLKSLQAEKKDLLLIYTPEEEKVKVIDDKINDLKEYLIESVANTTRNLEIKYLNLSKDIEGFEKVFITVPEKEKIITVMNREFEIYQKTYISLNEKRIEARIAKAAKIAFHRIISPAEPSKNPVSPNRPIIIIVSAIMGMFGSILLIHIVHVAKAKVNDKYTIESNSGIPIAMLTPRLKNAQEIQNYFLQEAGQLEMKELIKHKGVICLSSFKLEEGALFNAFHLAKALSEQNRKVLIIDVADAMQNGGNNNAVPESIKKGLDLIVLTNSEFKSFTKIRMKSFIENLKQSYDIILILNEELGKQKSLLLMSVATTNLVAVDTRLTQARKIIEVDLLKEEYDLPSVQFILNRHNYNPNIIKEILILLKKAFWHRKKQPWQKRTMQMLGTVMIFISSWGFLGNFETKFEKRYYSNNGGENELLLMEENANQGKVIQSKGSDEVVEKTIPLAISNKDENVILQRSKTIRKKETSLGIPTEKISDDKMYHLIVGSFKDRKNAEKIARRYQDYNYTPKIVFYPKKRLHLVSITEYARRNIATIESKKISRILNAKVIVIKI
jgi:uncharacterized protein involved in exopolysaccharide biosynthesis